jgi:small-conductance mechanosensitive channel
MELGWLSGSQLDPARIERMMAASPVGASVGIVAAAILAGMFASWLVMSMIRRWGRRSDQALERLLAQHLRTPLRILAPIVAVLVVFPALDVDAQRIEVLKQVLSIAGIMSATWLAVGVIEVVERYTVSRYDLHGADAVLARSVQTRVRVGRNLGVVVVFVLGSAIAFTTIEPVRQLGTSLLASAGVAGVVVGFAAQRTIATLLAGVQIAFTEPVRIDDVVVVEGEGGRVEEIALTYVVVRLWDQRRLVVPITWFLEKPFQNWTRNETQLLGGVDLKLHPSVAMAEIRAELERILRSTGSLWDGRSHQVQVTDMSDVNVTVRLMVSAADASKLWDLRCAVREGMLEYIRTHPSARPRMIAAVEEPPAAPG